MTQSRRIGPGYRKCALQSSANFWQSSRQSLERKPQGYSLPGASLKPRRWKKQAQVLENATGPEATFLKAQEALRSRRFREAADYFAELTGSTNEFSIEARLGLADTQKARGELEAALKTLDPLIADEGSADPRAKLIAAEIFLTQSNFSEAEKLISGLKANSQKYRGGKNMPRR